MYQLEGAQLPASCSFARGNLNNWNVSIVKSSDLLVWCLEKSTKNIFSIMVALFHGDLAWYKNKMISPSENPRQGCKFGPEKSSRQSLETTIFRFLVVPSVAACLRTCFWGTNLQPLQDYSYKHFLELEGSNDSDKKKSSFSFGGKNSQPPACW